MNCLVHAAVLRSVEVRVELAVKLTGTSRSGGHVTYVCGDSDVALSASTRDAFRVVSHTWNWVTLCDDPNDPLTQ